MLWLKMLPVSPTMHSVGSCVTCAQVMGEIMEQEGATIFNGARYKPLPAIAQARSPADADIATNTCVVPSAADHFANDRYLQL